MTWPPSRSVLQLPHVPAYGVGRQLIALANRHVEGGVDLAGNGAWALLHTLHPSRNSSDIILFLKASIVRMTSCQLVNHIQHVARAFITARLGCATPDLPIHLRVGPSGASHSSISTLLGHSRLFELPRKRPSEGWDSAGVEGLPAGCRWLSTHDKRRLAGLHLSITRLLLSVHHPQPCPTWSPSSPLMTRLP